MNSKKVLLWILVLFCMVTAANATIYFNDTFPSDVNNWVQVGTVLWENGHMVVVKGSNNPTSANNKSVSAGVEAPVWEFDINCTAVETSEGITLRFRSSTTTCVYLYACDNSKLQYNAGGLHDITSMSARTQMHIQVRNIDFATDTFDVWTDGVQRVTGAAFFSPCNNWDNIHYEAGSTTKDNNISIDNVCVSTESGECAGLPLIPPPNVTTPLINNTLPSIYDDLMANATPTFNTTGNITFKWYFNKVLIYQTNFSGIASGATQESVLDSSYITSAGSLNVTATVTDGGGSVSRTSATIQYVLPTLSGFYPENGTNYGLNGSTYDYTGFINFTTSVNSTVWMNDTRWSVVFSNGTFHSYYNAGYATLPDGTYNIMINATNAVSQLVASQVLTFFVDTNPPNYFNNLNGTIGLNKILFQINFTDDVVLYSINLSAPNFTHYQKGLNTTFYSFNSTLWLTNHTVGAHTMNLEVCDGHTKKEIGIFDFEKDKDNKKLTFLFGDESISVYAKDKNKFDDVFTTKYTDRYGFEFIKDINNHDVEHVYVVKSTEKIDVVMNNKYTGWLIIPSLKKWIDFENPQRYTAKVKRIDEYTIEITSKGTIFNSVGSLNCKNATLTYYKINQKLIFTSPIVELVSTNYTVSINRTGVPINSLSATLSYNGTLIPFTNYTITSSMVNFTVSRFTPEIYGTDHNNTYTVRYNYSIGGFLFNTSTQNQLVFNALLVNCSKTSPYIIYNISIFNENSLNALVATLKGTFYYWTGNYSQRQNTTLDLSGYNNYLICTSANTTIYVESYFQTVNAFTHRHYLFNDEVIPSQKEQLFLYNLNATTGFSDFRGFTRYASDYDYFQNVVTSMQRFYPAENVWRTVQMDKSDDFGLVFFNVIEENTDYRFVFSTTNNVVLRTTNNMKFSCDVGICELTFLLDPTTTSASLGNFVTVVTYNNVTNIVTANWSDSLGNSHTVITNVSLERLGGTYNICGFRQVGASAGSVTCNVTGYTGQLRITFSTNTAWIPRAVHWIKLSGATLATFLSSFDTALITGAIIIMSVFAGIISPVMTLITGIFGMIFVMLLGIFTPLSMTVLIIFIALSVVMAKLIKT